MDYPLDYFVEDFIGEFLIEEEIFGIDDVVFVEEGVVFPDLHLDVLGKQSVGNPEVVICILQHQNLLLYVVLLVFEVESFLGMGGLLIRNTVVLEIEMGGLLDFLEDAFTREYALVVGDIGLGLWNFKAGDKLPIHEDGLVYLQLGEALLDLLLIHDLVVEFVLDLHLAVLALEVPGNRFVVVFKGAQRGGVLVPFQLDHCKFDLLDVSVHGDCQKLRGADDFQQVEDVIVGEGRYVPHHQDLDYFECLLHGHQLENAFMLEYQFADGNVEGAVLFVEVE